MTKDYLTEDELNRLRSDRFFVPITDGWLQYYPWDKMIVLHFANRGGKALLMWRHGPMPALKDAVHYALSQRDYWYQRIQRERPYGFSCIEVEVDS